ncbi:DUF218 domain-containing protein [Chitinophaga costaii]|uniref:DUF218 domain-containing protein n=1 Tax=Chitinophaga costaii TaxID=1335309 RepID=A0A1C4C9R7_9BACT|nr:YdcF family protein [Chitinophaga costaii]PUZ27175.1 YdcF family protein [Chitinophaga costaii]SCC15889.1 DUF218 domain-containing protein [Chitinophaga costaii]
MNKRYLWQVLLGLLLANTLSAAAPAVPPVKNFGTQWTQKIFPLIAAIQSQATLRKSLRNDPTLHLLARQRAAAATAAANDCHDLNGLVTPLLWTVPDADHTASALIHLLGTDTALQGTIARLRQQHAYPLYEDLADSEYLRKSWLDVVRGTNQVLAVYLQGKPPRYARIDSISFRFRDPGAVQQVRQLVKTVLRKDKGDFYTLALQSAIAALELNGRDEATRYEPLRGGSNRPPYEALANIQWNNYPYSAILVPGQGPETLTTPLDANGIKRCALAAEHYQKHEAPFIIVSGGHVHPFKTPYAEAVEMKKYLVQQLGLPDQAVFIEPYARHTTTNLRNAARMWYRFGMPSQQPLLIVSDALQSLYIGASGMARRCKEELGYAPYKELHKAGREETIFLPLLNNLQPDPMDPLDP